MAHPEFASLTVLDHPLIRHKLAIMRDRTTTTKDFRQLLGEIAMLMTYDITRDLSTEPFEVESPLERTIANRLSGKKLVLVPILRAGLGMVDGILQLLVHANGMQLRSEHKQIFYVCKHQILQKMRLVLFLEAKQ